MRRVNSPQATRPMNELIGERLSDELGARELIRYQRPELPPLNDVSRYYALSEDAGFYSNGGPCHQLLAARLAAFAGGGVCVPVANARSA